MTQTLADKELIEALRERCGYEFCSDIEIMMRAADRIEDLTAPSTIGDGVVVDDKMVERGAKTIPATGIDWKTLHVEYRLSCMDTARRVLTAALQTKDGN